MEAKKHTMSVLMLPWLAHGHINPFLELAKKLASKNFDIYLCSTLVNLLSIKKRVGEKYSESIELIELHLPSLPDLPPHYHTTNGLPPHLMNTLKTAFELASPNFSKILQTLRPDLVIHDYNQPWVTDSASSMNIPAVQFPTFSATVVALSIHMSENTTEKFPFPEIYLREHEMISLKKDINEVPSKKFPYDEAIRRSHDIILVKTCRDFEGKYIDYLSNLTSKKVVPVGSLVQETMDQDDYKEIAQWLDKKEKSSTVFVSFGSEYFLSKEEILAVAQGLELSKVNFIWVIRFPQGERMNIRDALPKEYLERVGERGMVIEGWAPQATILQHPSIGGFVSHCGWSSFMESMKFGVPIIAMPMHIDQPMNARLVEYIGVGVEAAKDEDGKLQSEEIAKAIREVVAEESGEDVRKKVKEVKLSNLKVVPVGSPVQDLITNDADDMELIDWLGSKDENSTVFVSFGSEYFLSKEDMEEVALGLELSNVNFVWVARFPKGEEQNLEDALPKGFLERIGERGRVLDKFAPQLRILNHTSTGGFISHCGWNSVMESIHFGVPIVAMPMHLDQPMNARLIVELGVAVEIVRDDDGKIYREEIAKTLKDVITERIGENLRAKMREISKNLNSISGEEMDAAAHELIQFCKISTN
ncbi:beta-D-glucosyl crocetin beta-1,6-glucosyltransferase-like [Solanum lycopersicum]|uniref:beta-D-glucosyl crocetin beta-1,6-glucosyltransferase-like n=1 Tax=Solanum lycopersicum TaxID=4081 RepID=UPI003748AD98